MVSPKLDSFWTSSGVSSASRNMALDEALLGLAINKKIPLIIRFYAWQDATVSFGFFQPYGQLEKFMSDKVPKNTKPYFDCVRRPTGGGWVWHKGDFTFSIILSIERFLLEKNYEGSYLKIHSILRSAFSSVDLNLDLYSGVPPRHRSASLQQSVIDGCFSQPLRSDLMCERRKVLGGAQLRRRGYLLYQGTLQYKDRLIHQSLLQSSIVKAMQEAFNTQINCAHDLGEILDEQGVNKLVEKYQSQKWTKKR